MATKTIQLPEIGEVRLHKRRGARNIRLSVTAAGQVRVSLPFWAPFSAGVDFAVQKSDWIVAQRRPATVLDNNSLIGQQHTLRFAPSSTGKVSTRTTDKVITVKLPTGVVISDKAAQIVAQRAGIRALKQEAEELLPARVRRLADEHGFSVRSIEIKHLKSRWGSCNQQKEIVLNCFLMQLPWHLIDYVIMHELTHTHVMAHGPKFWGELSAYVTDLQSVRKEMRTHQPQLRGVTSITTMS